MSKGIQNGGGSQWRDDEHNTRGQRQKPVHGLGEKYRPNPAMPSAPPRRMPRTTTGSGAAVTPGRRLGSRTRAHSDSTAIRRVALRAAGNDDRRRGALAAAEAAWSGGLEWLQPRLRRKRRRQTHYWQHSGSARSPRMFAGGEDGENRCGDGSANHTCHAQFPRLGPGRGRAVQCARSASDIRPTV